MRRRRAAGEDGQYLPLFGAALFCVLVVGFVLFQVGAASALKSRAQTSADAGALAGVLEIKRQIEAAGLEGLPPNAINHAAVCIAAASYAARNGGRVRDCDVVLYDVKLVVETTEGIEGDIASSEGKKAEARARASLGVQYAAGFGAGALAGPGNRGGTNCMTDAEIEKVEEAANVRLRASSALRTYCGSGGGDGADVRDLKLPMQVAIAKAEEILGRPLSINSGFRTVAYQRVLCARVSGPCAPPGQSMHNFGLAIDTGDWDALNDIAGRVGLCWPLGMDDAVHFSVASGPECGGGGGGGGVGGVAPSLGGLAIYAPKLVPWEGGGDFGLPAFAVAIAPGNVAAAMARIAECESGGDPGAIGYGPAVGHYGKWQFDIPTWRSVGGAGNPADASEEEQDRRAWLLYQQRGFQPWECARLLGII